MKRTLSIVLVIALLTLAFAALRPPASQAQSSTLTFAIIGDYGMDNSPEASVASLVAGWNPELIITTGDDYYSSAGGTGAAKYDESTGAYYCNFLKDITTSGTRCPVGLAATNKFFPSLGNHDYSDAGTTNNLPTTYTNYFTLPGAGYTSSTTNERYYDFVAGPVHFFVVNSNPGAGQEPDGITSTSVQGQWLQTRLAASTSPWNIVYFHHPPFSSGSSHGSTPGMQWPFAAWGADAVINGHDHTYERILRDGIVYMVNGTGGASLYTFGTPVTGSVVRYNANHGAQKVIASDTSITFEFYSIAGGSTLVDSYTITAGGPTPTATATATPDPALSLNFQDGVFPNAGYGGTSDTYISQASPAVNYGVAAALLADGDDPPGTGSDLSSLLRWDVSQVPAGSVVQSASLTFNVTNISNNGYPIYEMKQTWVENQANWSEFAAASPWQMAGALGANDRGASVGNLAAPALGLVTVNLNAAGVAVVQAWIDNPSVNNGLIIASASNTDGVDFDASEASVAANRPRLTIRYLPSAGTPTATFIPTPEPTLTLPPTATFSPTPTATFTATPTPQTMHVSDLDPTCAPNGSKWNAQVTITVHGANHAPLSGVTVTGAWSQGASGAGTCTTNAAGQCTIVKNNISGKSASAIFSITGLASSGYSYTSSANHDPEADSNGTVIIVLKP